MHHPCGLSAALMLQNHLSGLRFVCPLCRESQNTGASCSGRNACLTWPKRKDRRARFLTPAPVKKQKWGVCVQQGGGQGLGGPGNWGTGSTLSHHASGSEQLVWLPWRRSFSLQNKLINPLGDPEVISSSLTETPQKPLKTSFMRTNTVEQSDRLTCLRPN